MAQQIAIIKNGLVQNVGSWFGDQSWWTSMEKDGFTLVNITMINPQPGIGWSYDGSNFTAPAPDLNL